MKESRWYGSGVLVGASMSGGVYGGLVIVLLSALHVAGLPALLLVAIVPLVCMRWLPMDSSDDKHSTVLKLMRDSLPVTVFFVLIWHDDGSMIWGRLVVGGIAAVLAGIIAYWLLHLLDRHRGSTG